MPSLLSPLLFVLLLSAVYARPASNIWGVNILEDPAPPANEGPALSAHALRDPSKLKYEVIGIVGAYVFCLILATVLILVGRRLRTTAQTSNRSLSMEMVKPAAQVNQAALGTGPSPVSPRREAFHLPFQSSSKSHFSHPSVTSVSTIDEKVVEGDRARNMDEMSKLYAAVMAHDDQKSRQVRDEARPQPSPTSPVHQPPELQHLRNISSTAASSDMLSGPTAADTHSEAAMRSRASSRKTKASPLSFMSNGPRPDSANSQKSRPSRISIRGQHISQPMGSADLRESAAYSEEAPLSPRLYTPGPPPATPGQKSAAAQAREKERKKGPPAALSIRSHAATDSTNSLPFRQQYAESLQSAPSTKTTFLERRETLLNNGARTGVPMTPYSPYQPFTPLTPITPRRLMTREDMKKSKKKNGLKVLSEDDMVQGDDDLWDSVS